MSEQKPYAEFLVNANVYREGRTDWELGENLQVRDRGPELDLERAGHPELTWPGEGTIKRIEKSGNYTALRWTDERTSEQVVVHVKLQGFGARDTDPTANKPPMSVAQKIAIKDAKERSTRAKINDDDVIDA